MHCEQTEMFSGHNETDLVLIIITANTVAAAVIVGDSNASDVKHIVSIWIMLKSHITDPSNFIEISQHLVHT